MAIDKIFNDASVDGIADNLFKSVSNSVSEVKAMQQRKAAENVQLVVQALKKIEGDLRQTNQEVANELATRIASIKDGKDGKDGINAKDGKDGRPGRDGAKGDKGDRGLDGRNGIDGKDGVSVTDAKIDFDGSLIITLSTGQEINVGEVVSPDLADKIQVISTMSTNGAVGIKDEGTSISTGVKNINFVGATVTATNSGDDVTVNVSAGTGTVTSVAVSGGTTGLTTSGGPITTTGTITLAGTLAVANGGTGVTTSTGTTNVVLSNSPTLVTPALGTPSALVGTNITGTAANFNINGTVGATTPASGAFTTLSATGVTTVQAGTAALPAITTTGDTNTGIFFPAADTIAFTEGGAEAMRIDSSGNVGIGTSSPSQRLQVTGSSAATTVGTATSIAITSSTGLTAPAGDVYLQSVIDSATPGDRGTALAFFTGRSAGIAERARIDSLGNVGIGTTSPAAKLDVSTTGAVATFTTTQTTGNAVTINVDGASGTPVGLRISAGIATIGSTAKLINVINSAGDNLFNAQVSGVIGVGSGIAFPATQSASANANTLDDYEEGTWTPSLGGTATYTVQQGNYTKIGRMVNIRCNIVVGLIGTGSVTTISGLPFTSFTTSNANPTASASVGYFESLAVSPVYISAFVASNATTMNVTGLTAAGATSSSGLAVFGNSARIDLTVTYFV